MSAIVRIGEVAPNHPRIEIMTPSGCGGAASGSNIRMKHQNPESTTTTKQACVPLQRCRYNEVLLPARRRLFDDTGNLLPYRSRDRPRQVRVEMASRGARLRVNVTTEAHGWPQLTVEVPGIAAFRKD